jgi:ribosome-binding protein aMBF1 (putative translation factor)
VFSAGVPIWLICIGVRSQEYLFFRYLEIIYRVQAAFEKAAMSKSIHRAEYQVLLDLLRKQRIQAGLTQAQCSAALGRGQSFLSDVERGSRRLDLVQLRDLCHFLGTDLGEFVADFEKELSRGRKTRR